jgi:hypothetical protein
MIADTPTRVGADEHGAPYVEVDAYEFGTQAPRTLRFRAVLPPGGVGRVVLLSERHDGAGSYCLAIPAKYIDRAIAALVAARRLVNEHGRPRPAEHERGHTPGVPMGNKRVAP